MKNNLKSFLPALVFILGFFAVANPSFAGVGTRGGADLSKVHEEIYENWLLSGGLNQLVKTYALKIDPTKMVIPEMGALWISMMNDGLINDIQTSKYVPSHNCGTGADPGAAASAEIGGKLSGHTDVCFNVDLLIQDRTTMATLIAMAIHEHVHIYGRGELDAYAMTSMVGAQLASMSISNNMDSLSPSPEKVSKGLRDNRLATNLGGHLKMKLVQNLQGIEDPVIQNGRIFSTHAYVGVGVYCEMAMGTREIQRGKTYLVKNVENGWSGTPFIAGSSSAISIWLMGTHGEAAELYCAKDEGGAQLTLSDLQSALDGVFELKVN